MKNEADFIYSLIELASVFVLLFFWVLGSAKSYFFFF